MRDQREYSVAICVPQVHCQSEIILFLGEIFCSWHKSIANIYNSQGILKSRVSVKQKTVNKNNSLLYDL